MITKVIMRLLFLALLSFSLFGCAFGILGRSVEPGGGLVSDGIYPASRIDAYLITTLDTRGGPFTPILGVIDLPFSVAFDTLLLPYDIFRQFKKLRSPALSPPQVESKTLALLSAGKQRYAEYIVQKYMALYPDNQRIIFLRACLLRSRFTIEAANELFRQVAMIDPNSVSGQCSLHMLSLDKRNNPEYHFEKLRTLVQNNPDDLMLRWMLAVQCRTYNKNEEGIQHYRKLLEKWNPGPALLHQTYANLLDDVGKSEEALVSRRKVIAFEPKGWGYQALGNTLTNLHRIDEADEAYKKAVKIAPEESSYWSSWAWTSIERKNSEEAISKCEKAISLDPNNYEAWKYLGIILEQQGKPLDAVKKYEKAAELNPDCEFAKERIKFITGDKQETFISFKKAADQGDARAQYNLGVMYEKGEGAPQNKEEAFAWYKKSADQSFADAQFALGLMYDKGDGVAQNKEESFKWFKKAADQSDPRAQYHLGVAYYKGVGGVTQNQEKAFTWFKKSAEQGNAVAQYFLGIMYYKGEGVSQNSQEAFAWLKKGAEQGNAEAQYSLGGFYYMGVGVAKNYQEAFIWAQKAAEQGHAAAQNNAGWQYDNGHGVAQDKKEAVIWYKKSAEQGYVMAQCNLARLYNNGYGAAGNKEEALLLFKKAADQGNADAQNILRNLNVSY